MRKRFEAGPAECHKFSPEEASRGYSPSNGNLKFSPEEASRGYSPSHGNLKFSPAGTQGRRSGTPRDAHRFTSLALRGRRSNRKKDGVGITSG